MAERPYSSRQLAEKLGHTGKHAADWFCRNYERLRAAGLPAPLLPFGYYKFDRAAVDAWLRADKQVALANDNAAAPAGEKSIEQHRAELARAYASAS